MNGEPLWGKMGEKLHEYMEGRTLFQEYYVEIWGVKNPEVRIYIGNSAHPLAVGEFYKLIVSTEKEVKRTFNYEGSFITNIDLTFSDRNGLMFVIKYKPN